MYPNLRNPFDARPPGKKGTADFLEALGDTEAAGLYRKHLGEDVAGQPQGFTSEELVRLQVIQERERALEFLRREYLDWAKEFGLGGDTPQTWLDETFTFKQDGTVDTKDDLYLFSGSVTRLPPALTRVNGVLSLVGTLLTTLADFPQEVRGDVILSHNRLSSLEGLPQKIPGDLVINRNQLSTLDDLPDEIGGDLDVSDNRKLRTLDGLKGKKIGGSLHLERIRAREIPEGIDIGGEVYVASGQDELWRDALDKGYYPVEAVSNKK